MKKLAVSFIFLTALISACSTTKSNSNATTQQLTANRNTVAPVKQKMTDQQPTQEAKMLPNAPERFLAKTKPSKTMEQSFDAAVGVRDSL